MANIIYIRLSAMRIRKILQYLTNNSLIRLWSCFEPDEEYRLLVQTPWLHKCSVGAGAFSQMHLVKPILEIEDGPDGIFGWFSKNIVDDGQWVLLPMDM